MRNVKRILQLCSIAMLALYIYSSCLNKSDDTSLDKSYGKSDSTETYHTIVSDDSLVTAIWYDTGEGGTAPDIDCVVKFESEDGEQHEEYDEPAARKNAEPAAAGEHKGLMQALIA